MVTPFSRSRSIPSSTCSVISRSEMVPVLQQPVGEGRFPVIDVRDNTKNCG